MRDAPGISDDDDDVIVMMKEMMMIFAVAVFILLILHYHYFHCVSEQICQLIFSVTKTINQNPPTQRPNVNGRISKPPRLRKPKKTVSCQLRCCLPRPTSSETEAVDYRSWEADDDAMD